MVLYRQLRADLAKIRGSNEPPSPSSNIIIPEHEEDVSVNDYFIKYLYVCNRVGACNLVFTMTVNLVQKVFDSDHADFSFDLPAFYPPSPNVLAIPGLGGCRPLGRYLADSEPPPGSWWPPLAGGVRPGCFMHWWATPNS